MFAGHVVLGESFTLTLLVTNSSQAPADLDALPSYRVYGPEGLMANGTGAAAYAETGSVSDASNASPIVIASSSHGLTTGQRVVISGVTGNTAANGTFTITRVDGSSFSLDGSAGNGAYVSGGTYHVLGLYDLSIDALAADGYEAGVTYFVLIVGELSSAAWSKLYSFVVG